MRTAINEKAPPRQGCYGCTKKHLTKKELYKKAIDKFLQYNDEDIENEKLLFPEESKSETSITSSEDSFLSDSSMMDEILEDED